MKKIMFSLAFMLIGSFAFANETINLDKNQSFKFEASNKKVVGLCHIQIIDLRTNEVVYDITLPANTPEACEDMGKATLKAFVEGKL